MAIYAEGVIHKIGMLQCRGCPAGRVKPFQGLMLDYAPTSQGALRDPGLWSETPLAFIQQLCFRLIPCRPATRLGDSRVINRPALSLIEVVASTMIVGLMAVAALNSLGAATRSSESIGNRAVALGLADELMSEILALPYKDPTQTPVLGRESGEPSGPRSAFDDVDDYDGWNQSPPQFRDGTVMPDRADWRHRVVVNYVVPGNPTQTSASDQGAKRIRVIVEYRSQVLAEQVAVRTNTDEQ